MAKAEVVAPVAAATILLITSESRGIEVLMVRRPLRGMFGGVWVFPGGVVDSADSDHDGALSDAPFRRAAVRELSEEVGITVDVETLTFVSRWVTPAVFPRRFDTRFFLASIERALPPLLAAEELEEAAYITPAAALGAHQAQHWPMVLPTLAHLRWLARFASVEEAMEAAGKARVDPVTPKVADDGSIIPIDLPW